MKRIAACVGLAGCLIAAPGAAAAAPANDAYTAPATLPLETRLTATTAEATVEGTDEPLTPPSGLACAGTTPAPAQMTHTVWFLVTPSTDGPLSVHTLTSTTNTVIAVYNTDGTGTPGNPPPDAGAGTTNMLGCNDDAGAFSSGSRVAFVGQAGFGYLVQVGTLSGSPPGQLKLYASVAPANDNRAGAATLSGGAVLRDNLGATEEGGEDLACGPSALGSTVWFKYEVTAPGTLSFITSHGQLNSVLQLYRGGETQPLSCNDDIQGEPSGPSFVSATVTPGTYFLQVGGLSGEQDDVTLNTTFSEDLDVDGDGSDRPADCDDNDASVRPGATDVPDNGVDEDCSGADAVNLDRDGDGSQRPADCDDTNPALRPGATDVPGNGVDEDCSGSDAATAGPQPTATPPAGPPPTTTTPTVDPAPLFTARLRMPASAFAAATSGPSVRRTGRGARVTYSLSEAAMVTFTVRDAKTGRRLPGSFTHAGRAGNNAFVFTGRLRGRALRAGTYRLVAVATDAAGQRSASRSTRFAIKRARRSRS